MSEQVSEQPVNVANLWIHCNRCFEFYALKRRRFFLLACNHITCDHCSPPKPSETPNGLPVFKCPLDKCAKVTRSYEIGNQMPAKIKELLHPQPYLMNVAHQRVWNFQQKHRENLLRGTQSVVESTERVDRNIESVREKNKLYYTKLEQLRHVRKQLEAKIRRAQERRKQRQEKLAVNATAPAERLQCPPPMSLPKKAATVATSTVTNEIQEFKLSQAESFVL